MSKDICVVIPTFNRATTLEKTLESILLAEKPEGSRIQIVVVDNNSNDATREVCQKFSNEFKGCEYEYVFEEQQGKSYALNTGIQRLKGDLFVCIDDDIEVDSKWFIEVNELFSERWEDLDFASGRMLPIWESDPPEWIEAVKESVLAIRDYGDEEWVHGMDTPIMTGGHGVMKLDVVREIGMYDVRLGPTGKDLVGCEDDALYETLLRNKYRGIYCPKLRFFHFVPSYRLTKKYFRNWNFGAGIGWSLKDKLIQEYSGRRLLGIPAYLYREALSGAKYGIISLIKNSPDSVKEEAKFWTFAGFLYQSHFSNGLLNTLSSPLKRLALGSVKR
ncbi:MAG: glycosyltransferase [Pyrinomonadaceae bacterium]